MVYCQEENEKHLLDDQSGEQVWQQDNDLSGSKTMTMKIKAASSIKRGSCFEGIRVCFYGVGQP